MILPKNQWPESVKSYLEGRRYVTEPDIAYNALL